MEDWLGSSLNQIQGWMTVPESYSRALEQGPLVEVLCGYLLLPSFLPFSEMLCPMGVGEEHDTEFQTDRI